MKKSLSPSQQKSRYFSFLRALALTALICTVLLAVFILIESVLPGETSSKQSASVGDIIQDIVGGNTDGGSGGNGGNNTQKNENVYCKILAFFGITVSPKVSYQLFIRKLAHFLLFAVLGTGLTATTFLLIKPRGLCPAVSFFAGLFVALLSEALQLPIFTTGRVCSLQDIGVDLFGLAIGMLFAVIVLSVYLIIKKLADKDGYALLKSTFKNTHARTILNKAGKTIAVHSDDDFAF